MCKFVVLVLSLAAIALNPQNLVVDAKVRPQHDFSYSQCIQKAFERQFVGESVMVILPKFHMRMSDRFSQLLHGTGTYAVTIVDKYGKSIARTLSPFSRSSRPENFLFLTTGRMDLIQSIDYLKSNELWNPMARVIAIVHNELVIAKQKSLLNMREMKKIFRLFVKERSLKVNVIAFDEHHVPTMFAWFPYDDENDCSYRVRIIQSVGKCLSDGNVRNEKYVVETSHTDRPTMPSVYTGCPLHITAIQTEPYVICNDQSACDNGLEVRLFESVSESLKLNLKLKVEKKVNEIMYSRILRRESDLLIGGINPLVKTRDHKFTQTVPYYQDELTWCVLGAPNISLWFGIFLVFNAEVWGYFSVITTFAGTVLRYFLKLHTHQQNWFYCFALGFFLAIGVPVPLNPTHPALRINFLTLSIYGILLTTTFNSFFMSRMTKSVKYKQIAAREDLIINSMKLYAENETIAMHRSSGSELFEYATRNFERCVDTNSCLEKLMLSSSNNIAVAASREHAMHYLGMKDESNIYCFNRSENIYVYPVAALAHEHNHLLDAINHQIQRVVENGLIIKWNADIKLKRKAITINHPVPFTIKNVSGAFVAMLIGLTLSWYTFAWELFIGKKCKSSNLHPNMWRLWESIWYTPESDAWTEVKRFARWKFLKRKNG